MIEISQVAVQEPEISENTSPSQNESAQNNSGQSFQKFLEEEQKRLGSLFSPYGQFNFSSWFAYPDAIPDKETSALSYLSLTDNTNQPSNSIYHQETNETNNTLPLARSAAASASQAFASPASAQSTLQEILMKTGWLTPNIQTIPQFNFAQLEGTLLQKIDLQALVDQIVSRVAMVKEKGKVELSLGLKPDNLGELLLTITAQGGMIYVSIQASEETRKLIQAQLNTLAEALKKANVNLGEIRVEAAKEAGKNA